MAPLLLLRQNYSVFPGFYLTEPIITVYCSNEIPTLWGLLEQKSFGETPETRSVRSFWGGFNSFNLSSFLATVWTKTLQKTCQSLEDFSTFYRKTLIIIQTLLCLYCSLSNITIRLTYNGLVIRQKILYLVIIRVVSTLLQQQCDINYTVIHETHSLDPYVSSNAFCCCKMQRNVNLPMRLNGKKVTKIIFQKLEARTFWALCPKSNADAELINKLVLNYMF